MTPELVEKDVATCTFCPKLCRVVCPVAEAEKRETVTPWGLATAVYLQGQGHATLEGEAAEILWHCTSCRRCQGYCQDHVDVPHTVMAARAQAFSRGDAPPRAQALAELMREQGNPTALDLPALARAAVDKKDVDPKADEILFPDCTTTRRYPEVLKAWMGVLRGVGQPVKLYSKNGVACCGAPLYHAGDLEGFDLHARGVHKALSTRSLIVVPSPGCAHILRDVYPQLGLTWSGRVVHPVELLKDKVGRLPEGVVEEAMLYQAPCHLTRSLGEDKTPVELLGRVCQVPPREPFHHGAHASCCGGGGGLPDIVPEVAGEVARRLVQELNPGPGEEIVTACSTCRERLERAGVSVRVRDLSEVLWSALEATSERTS